MFKLETQPLAYQMTIHKSNYEAHYGVGSFTYDYKMSLRAYNANVFSHKPLMDNLIRHYGVAYMERWFEEFMAA